MNEMFWYNHTRECYTALKTNYELLLLVTTWMHLTGMMKERETLAVPVAALELDNYDRLLAVFSTAQTPWVLFFEPAFPANPLILELPITFTVMLALVFCFVGDLSPFLAWNLGLESGSQ